MFGIQGVTSLSFVVSKDGYIKDIIIVKGIGGVFDEEATRLIQNMHKWKQGKFQAKNFNVFVNLNY